MKTEVLNHQSWQLKGRMVLCVLMACTVGSVLLPFTFTCNGAVLLPLFQAFSVLYPPSSGILFFVGDVL